MQALWSRGGQSRACGCRGCLQTAGGMIRQSTTRVGRRKPTFGEVFTAFYTSIMGTAAVLDAKRKDARRQDLNRQLEEAKADLEKLVNDHNRRTRVKGEQVPPPGHIQNRYEGAWRDYVKDRSQGDFFDALGSHKTWRRTGPRSADLDASWESLGLGQLDASLPSEQETNYDALLLGLELEKADPRIDHRWPRTHHKLDLSRRSTRSLVERLLKQADLRHLTNRKLYARHGDEEVPFHKELAEMHWGQSYPVWDTGVDPKTLSRELNQSLQTILAASREQFQKSPSDSLKEMVVKICHNLYVAPGPPTVHTYCTLLLGFNRLGQHKIAHEVVRHWYHDSKEEPTQILLACIFNHYKETRDIHRFHRFLKCCTGRYENGVYIRRKTLDRVRRDPLLRVWAAHKDVAVGPNFVVERAWFSDDLVDMIVQSFLSLSCLKQAASTVAFAWDRGVRFCARTVMQIFDRCLKSLDDDAAWQLIDSLTRNAKSLRVHGTVAECRLLVQKLQTLSELCGLNVELNLSNVTLPGGAQTASLDLVAEDGQRRRRALHILLTMRKAEEARRNTDTIFEEWQRYASQRAAESQVALWKLDAQSPQRCLDAGNGDGGQADGEAKRHAGIPIGFFEKNVDGAQQEDTTHSGASTWMQSLSNWASRVTKPT